MKLARLLSGTVLLVTFNSFFFCIELLAAQEIDTFLAIIATDINGGPDHIDGNTSSVLLKSNPKKTITVRWLYIDAPETERSKKKGCNGQPYGVEAKKELDINLPAGTEVEIYSRGKDMHGRTLAEVYYKGKNMNLWMLRNGHAETPEGWKIPKLYFEAESIAQKEKKGIWGLKHYEPPKRYRRRCNIQSQEINYQP
jgi:endonuclease YncB( thermonuclease family)